MLVTRFLTRLSPDYDDQVGSLMSRIHLGLVTQEELDVIHEETMELLVDATGSSSQVHELSLQLESIRLERDALQVANAQLSLDLKGNTPSMDNKKTFNKLWTKNPLDL